MDIIKSSTLKLLRTSVILIKWKINSPQAMIMTSKVLTFNSD